MSNVNFEEIIEKLSSLSVLDMAKLKTALEEKWGVKASAGASMMMAAPAAAPAEAASESTEFKLTLESVPDAKKINVIKVIREILGFGLKEAKDFVEGAPKVVKEAAGKAEATEMKKKLEDAGAVVSLKGL
ncbi:MAG: 50S ribosomal protein L7/L12 [Chlamydiota bacterium]